MRVCGSFGSGVCVYSNTVCCYSQRVFVSVSLDGRAMCNLSSPVLLLGAACMLLQAALPLRRTTYEGRWQQLEAWPAGKPIRYQDIPWPCPTPGSQAAARKQQQQQEALQLDPQQLRTLVLAGTDVC